MTEKNLNPSIIGRPLQFTDFESLSGKMAGYSFVKVVVDRPSKTIHFINHDRYKFHAHYIAENILNESWEAMEARIDEFNRSTYLSPERRFYLGIIAFHDTPERKFLTFETVEVDTMNAEMLTFFFNFVRENLDCGLPLLIKPANHLQEAIVGGIDPAQMPRVYNHELFASANFIPLNPGRAQGRIRLFKTDAEYDENFSSIAWYDIVVMKRVPDDIPRVAGIINAAHTTPLSHTNVLATGWKIPNAIQLGIDEEIETRNLNGEWVIYRVESNAPKVLIEKAEKPTEILERPTSSVFRVKLEEPEVRNTPICELDALRMSDRFRYGTKAANLGEIRYVLEKGSERLLGFYRVKRAPRPNLLSYFAKLINVPESADLSKAALEFLRKSIQVPRGIAIPFSLQQEFLESSPKIQQTIGKLKMALELGAKQVDPLCMQLQQLIRSTRFPERMRDAIDVQISRTLGGVSSFVVRSSSNAEDLENFSAAGIYESINHVTTAENIIESIKEVWASLVSPRSVRLRHEVGISLDDCYMGVIVQEEVEAEMGGVLVTTNPTAGVEDFRNVFINVSTRSVVNIVQGSELPYQYLYNTVEGGGQTLSIGNAKTDLDERRKAQLQKLAIVGRLLQSHFSRDYTFNSPVDIEWAASKTELFILQARPYAIGAGMRT